MPRRRKKLPERFKTLREEIGVKSMSKDTVEALKNVVELGIFAGFAYGVYTVFIALLG